MTVAAPAAPPSVLRNRSLAKALPVYGSRHVVAVAAAGRLVAMVYAGKMTLTHLAKGAA